MSSLNSDIKSLSRKIEKGGDELAWRYGRSVKTGEQSADHASREAGGAAPADERRRAAAQPVYAAVTDDERFANYFVTGSLRRQGLRTREKGVERNKAVFVLILLIVVLIVVVYLISR